MRSTLLGWRGSLGQGLLGAALLLSTNAWAAPVPLNWVPANGTVISGSTSSRVGGDAFSDTAVGARALTSGPGYVEFSTMESDHAKAAGLGSRDSNRGLEAIDFGFLLRADGTAAVVERGAAVQAAGAYAAGDIFRVAVEGSAIVFRVNGTLIRTSALTFAFPLFPEATLAEAGGTISAAQIEGATAETVTWAGAVKAMASPGFLAKTSPAVAWDSGAASTMAIDGSDGYLETPASVGSTIAMIGLSHGSANSGYSDIDYALYMASGTLYIYEGGLNRGSFGTLAATDRLRVSVESGVVKYRKNGTLLYTSGVAPTFPLLVDSSLQSSGGRISGVVLSGTLVQVAVSRPTFSTGSGLYAGAQNVTITGEPGSTIHYTTSGLDPTEADPVIASGSAVLVDADTQLKARAWTSGLLPSSVTEALYVFGAADSQNVDWTAHVNAASNGSTLSKSTGTVAWDAGAISAGGLASPDGYLEVSAALAPNVAMVGLSHGNTNAGYSDIDFALYFASGTLYIYEGGLNRGSFGSLVSTDKLRVSVEGGVVRYRKNGVLLYSSALAPVYPLLVDASLNSSGALLSGAVLSGALIQAAVQNPVFSFPSGVYETPFDVVVTGASGSTIHYTTSGAEPTEADPTIASGATLLVDATVTLKAKAFASGLIPSGTTAAIYQFGTVSTEDVIWTAHVNTSSTGNTLSKTTGSVAWDASAISTRGIISPGGYLEVSASLSPNVAMVGLANGNANSGYSDIDYALYMASGTLYIYEGGLNRGSFGALAASDKLRVSVESGVVKYRKNGNLVYTSALAPTYPLLVDASLNSSGAAIKGAVVSGNLVQVAAARPEFTPGSGLFAAAQEVMVTAEPGSAIHYTTNGTEPTEADAVIASGQSLLIEPDTTLKAKAWATGLYQSGTTTAIYKFGTATTENVAWTAHVNSASTENTLSKTNGTTAWDASAVSTKALDSPDGYLEVNASLSPKIAMAGLAYANSNSGYSDIDFALYMASGTLYIYEGGLNRGSFGALQSTDKLRVSVEAGVVKYGKNGTLLYTSSIAPRYPLLVDTSLHSSTAVIQGAVLSGLLVNSRTSAPTASPEAGGHALPIEVALSAEAGATITYTTDGSDPTAASTPYATPINVPSATTIKARAFKPGYLDSDVSSLAYAPLPEAVAPTFTPQPGPYLGPLIVNATSTTPGALIHYTFNAGEPTAADPSVANGASVTVPESGTLRGIAVAPGYAPSSVTTATYELVATEPSISPNGGSFSGPVVVTLSGDPGATIYYTTDGSTPAAGSPTTAQYPGPFTLSETAMVKARAFVDGWTPSGVAAADFTVAHALVPPQTLTTGAVAFALKPDGTVWGWGNDYYGQLTLAAVPAGTTPLPVQLPITGVRKLAAGVGHVVALKSDGTVWGWGLNEQMQIGGTDYIVSSPRQIEGLSGVVSIAASDWASFAVKGDGTIWTWGTWAVGVSSTPVQVAGLTGVVAVASAGSEQLALKADGTVWFWTAGLSEPGILPTLTDVAWIGASSSTSFAVTASGAAYVWGAYLEQYFTEPVPLPTSAYCPEGCSSSGAVTDAREAYDGLVLHTDGRVSQVRHEGVNYSLQTVLPAGSTIAASAAYGHYLAVGADHSVWSWGLDGAPIGEGADISRPDPLDIALPDFNWRAGTPSISVGGVVDGEAPVAMNSLSPDAVLHYTTDGSTPTAASAEYAGEFQQGVAATVRAIAIAPGKAQSHVRDADVWGGPLPDVEFSPDGGSFPQVASVTVSHPTPGVTMHYRLDGEDPTAADPVVASGQTLTFERSVNLAVSAFKPYYDTAFHSALFVIEAPLPAPIITPPSGPQVGSLFLSAVVPEPGISIRYDFFGADPADWPYSSALPLELDYSPEFPWTGQPAFTVSLRAFNDFAPQQNSALVTRNYTIHSARPQIGPITSTPQGPRVAVTPAMADDVVHYSLDGSDPTVTHPAVPPGGEIAAAGLIKLMSIRGGGVIPSPVVTLDYRDSDGDGLTDTEELLLGTDPNNSDTNFDGITDANAVASGISATAMDVDSDGVLNAAERAQGTNPFDPDTDHDGYNDATDAFPLDPTRHQPGSPPGGDTTPPLITLVRPANAVKVGGQQ